MTVSYHSESEDTMIDALIAHLREKKRNPEAVLIVGEEGTLGGIVPMKNILNHEGNVQLKDIMIKPIFVYEDAEFSEIFDLFAEYNLRLVPVVDKVGKVIGVIPIDTILTQVKEKEEKESAI